MVLPIADDDEKEDEQPLHKSKKVINKVALDIPAEDLQEGAILSEYAILHKAMENISIAEAMEKEADGPFDVGTSVVSEETVAQSLKANEEEVLPASVAAVTEKTSIHLNYVSDNNLNYPNSPLLTKSPTLTLHVSPKPLPEHISSPQHDQKLSMGHVTSFSQPTLRSYTSTIVQILRDFSQQEIIPTTYVLEELNNHLANELHSDQN